MKVLGIETSCDETGVAIYDTDAGLLAHGLHSQIDLHAAYGGVVPELASRDHIRRLPVLIQQTLADAGLRAGEVDAVAYTSGPGLAGALLVGASVAESFAMARGIPALPVHHLEGHLLSPMLSADPPAFPFVALLVSGGHTQLMRVRGVGDYALLGESVDDAAGEAFDKTAKLLGLGYPGGPQLAKLAEQGVAGRFRLPRPMLHSGDLDFSFSGLKTAVLNIVSAPGWNPAAMADLAAEFGVEREAFLADFETDNLKHETWNYYATAQRAGVTGFPTLVGGPNEEGHYGIVNRGYQPAPAVLTVLHQWLGTEPDAPTPA